MTQLASPPRYDRWKAPPADGESLIWPTPDSLLKQTRENHEHLSSTASVLIQNIPLPEVRTRLRQWLGHTNDDQLLIATGHQAELHHAGVWAKNALIHAAAECVQARAMHFAVDTDEPKHLRLRWPGGSVALTDAESPREAWSGLVASPSPAHLADVSDAFAAAANTWEFRSSVPQFLQSMRKLAIDAPNLPTALTNSLHELDWSLGLRHDALLVSPMCLSEPYLVFVHHILARADEFAADYNASLDEYRRENKIRTLGRPMPNLQCTVDGCEAPFWLDDTTTGMRARAAVVRDSGAFILRLTGGQTFRLDPRADGWSAAGELMLFLRRHGARLSPRALTLTAVLRMLAADQFVHGIGGGQYDQVLDKLISRHFQIEAPRFSVTTATLYFPAAVGQPRVCLPCVAQDGHRIKHDVLGEKKMQWLTAIDSAPRNSIERSVLFADMHEKLSIARSGKAFRDWEAGYLAAQHEAQQEKVLFDRELFYAIQPADRLSGMIEKYREAFVTR